MRATLLLLAVVALAGCSALSFEEVKPWERGVLAQDNMQLIPDAMQSYADDHMYFSKEAATGGKAVGAGGCGCN